MERWRWQWVTAAGALALSLVSGIAAVATGLVSVRDAYDKLFGRQQLTVAIRDLHVFPQFTSFLAGGPTRDLEFVIDKDGNAEARNCVPDLMIDGDSAVVFDVRDERAEGPLLPAKPFELTRGSLQRPVRLRYIEAAWDTVTDLGRNYALEVRVRCENVVTPWTKQSQVPGKQKIF